MTTYADSYTTQIVAGVECDGQDGECPNALQEEHPLDAPLPDPTSGDRDDPAWVALRSYGEQAEALAERHGWLSNPVGQFCPDCAIHAPGEDARRPPSAPSREPAASWSPRVSCAGVRPYS